MLHHNPCLIYHEESFFLLRSYFGPDIIENVVHGWCLETIFDISDAKDSEPIVEVYVGFVVEQLSKCTGNVLAEFECKFTSTVHTFENVHEIFHEWDGFAFDDIIVHGDFFERIGCLECFVE